MKIDIHVHTRKIKSGDAITRNIEPDKFSEIIKNTDVKILAITNHNHFDIEQYESLKESVIDNCQIWPGVELDILEENSSKRAHLLIIANPKQVADFDKRVSNILSGKNADTFTIPLQETVSTFGDLDCIYVAHYLAKKPNLGDEEIEKLSTLVSNPKRILKEATNSISAGIYISHGHNSIYGSDVHNWDDYVDISKELPELRLPVESFEQFCLLLEKDEATINTILSKKVKENIELNPFGIAELIRLDIYNDINILFGSKGTGKTEILEALSKYFNSKGHKTTVYKSNDLHLNQAFDLKGITPTLDVTNWRIDTCENDIDFIKNVTEEEVTSISKYYLHFATQETNKISLKLKIKNITQENEAPPSRELQEINVVQKKFEAFREFIGGDNALRQYVSAELIDELIAPLEEIISILTTETENKFVEAKSIKLLNNIISAFITEISKKTGQPPKPTKTGFAAYAGNRIKIELAVKKILNNVKQDIEPIKEYAGSLGIKGELFCQTNLKIQNGAFIDGSYSVAKKVKKTPQKEFALKINLIAKHIYSTELFEKITELNEIEGIETIQNINDLLLFHKHFTLSGTSYQPSNGESSMILLHKELIEDKDIYLIDEPEKSLGNDYINDVIVPLLKEKALLGKKIIVATHDANIAVRTLPYNSIYRLHDRNKYYTLTGNPFSNKLKCIWGLKPDLDWKEVSMKTLEGGKDAFGERGKIYGN